ncbi:hypothetical protein [Natronocalculus amylovorans]|uniref:DUF8119 domain-containing protein n=1 Tax=Natronocalculus amylovorans TaxID=2917812 RepID=A0AAE3K8Q1_9EURY|nr:hypothetical protein [Natronocalculus amylovorans]MCL9817271.1 hypothetical protein [Natronocalculus amylovorans]
MSRLDGFLTDVRAQKWGMVGDLAFAIVWVTIVSAIFSILDGPTWAYYMFMLAGIVAYFGFVGSLERAQQR